MTQLNEVLKKSDFNPDQIIIDSDLKVHKKSFGNRVIAFISNLLGSIGIHLFDGKFEFVRVAGKIHNYYLDSKGESINANQPTFNEIEQVKSNLEKLKQKSHSVDTQNLIDETINALKPFISSSPSPRSGSVSFDCGSVEGRECMRQDEKKQIRADFDLDLKGEPRFENLNQDTQNSVEKVYELLDQKKVAWEDLKEPLWIVLNARMEKFPKLVISAVDILKVDITNMTLKQYNDVRLKCHTKFFEDPKKSPHELKRLFISETKYSSFGSSDDRAELAGLVILRHGKVDSTETLFLERCEELKPFFKIIKKNAEVIKGAKEKFEEKTIGRLLSRIANTMDLESVALVKKAENGEIELPKFEDVLVQKNTEILDRYKKIFNEETIEAVRISLAEKADMTISEFEEKIEKGEMELPEFTKVLKHYLDKFPQTSDEPHNDLVFLFGFFSELFNSIKAEDYIFRVFGVKYAESVFSSKGIASYLEGLKIGRKNYRAFRDQAFENARKIVDIVKSEDGAQSYLSQLPEKSEFEIFNDLEKIILLLDKIFDKSKAQELTQKIFMTEEKLSSFKEKNVGDFLKSRDVFKKKDPDHLSVKDELELINYRNEIFAAAEDSIRKEFQ
ncbi:MAG: hypothetical protein K1000chlam2_01117 [Chlamydiae bacterium]|nr:hypothetical protein [Chlamydiota bacterium]